MQSTKQLSPLPTPSSVRVFQCRRLRTVPGLRDEEVKTARTYINWRCRCGMRHRYQPCQHDVRRIRGRQCTTSTPDSRRLSHTPKVAISSYFVVWLSLQLFLVFSAFLIKMFVLSLQKHTRTRQSRRHFYQRNRRRQLHARARILLYKSARCRRCTRRRPQRNHQRAQCSSRELEQ